MSAFADALDLVYADDNMALDARYTPAGGSPVGVRVIKATESSYQQRFGQAGFLASPAKQLAGIAVSVRRSEIATVSRGDAFALADGSGGYGAAQSVREVRPSESGLEWLAVLQAP